MKLLDVFSIINDSKFLIERDVFNAKELKQWVAKSAERLQDPQTRTWYASQLFKYLINRYEDGLRTAQFDAQAPDWVMAKLEAGEQIFTVEPQQKLRQEAEAVIDWLNAQTAENAQPNLRMTWEDAVEAQAEWHRDIARASRVTELTAEQMEGIVTIMEFDDGYRWVDVQTEICLKHEGTIMGHCVGQGGYTEGVKEGTTKILSLRDANNNPHATLQGQSEHPIIITAAMMSSGQRDLFADNAVEKSFVDMMVTQIKGKENKAVVRKYRDYVQEFLTKFQIEKFNDMGLNDLESSGLFKLHDFGFKSIEEAGQEVVKMDDGTSWHRVNNDEVQLKDYTDNLAAKWYLYDKTGRSIGGLVEKEEGVISGFNFPYGVKAKPYKEHVQKVFDTGVKPDDYLYQNWDSVLGKMDLGVNNGKVGNPQDIGVHKGTTTAGEIWATEQSNTYRSGDVYWLINGDKIQSQFVMKNNADEKGTPYKEHPLLFDKDHGLPNGSMPKFLKEFEDIFLNRITINFIIVQGDRTISVADMEWKPDKGSEFIMEEDGVKFYTHVNARTNASDPDWERTEDDDTWYMGVDSHDHLIFSMNIDKKNFKVRMVSDYKVAGYYAIYLIEHLDLDVGYFSHYDSFARTLLEETGWFQSTYTPGVITWMVQDDDYPIRLVVTNYYDDNSEETIYDEQTTMDEYWDQTNLRDTGLEDDYFANEYDRVYRGMDTDWEDERYGDDEEGAGPELTTTTYTASEGDNADSDVVTHPFSGGSMRISL